ncbi:MAG: ABC transporter permease, partial [marine benthic group bacterium]|nr:ABC transporter permease [Candidatus Benthicola marisminoris]
MIAAFLSDLRYAFRHMIKKPGFAIIAILTLTLGIGANAAIFSVLDAVVLSPLRFPEPERLIRIYEADRESSAETGIGYHTVPDFLDLRREAEGIERLAAIYTYREAGRDLTDGDVPRRIRVLPTSAAYFEVWGISPLLGRSFATDEEREDANVAILSYGLWQSHTGGDPDVLGTTIRLDGEAYTVVGVAPAGFRDVAAGDVDAWVPLDLVEGEYSRQNHFLSLIGRLDRGVSVGQAQTYVSAVNARIVEEYEEVGDTQLMRVVSLHEDVVGSTDAMLQILMGAAGFVLLIACVNVANLFLARSMGRRREIAIRSALGSGRGRLVRQFLAESLLIASLAGVAGVAMARIGVRVLLAISPDAVARAPEVGLDGRLVLFAAAVTVLTALLFGLVPALRGSRVDLTSDLREGSRGTSGGRRSTRVRTVLVAAQVALALVLLIGAGLMIKSFATLQGQDLGFDPSDLLTFEVHLPDARYEDPALRVDFHQRFHERLRAIPGVESVAATSWLPAAGPYHDWGFRYEMPSGALDWEGAQMRIIEGDYFETMGIPLRSGRTFDAGDGEDAPPVMIISETAAEIAFPGEDPIGQRFFSADTVRAVAGVVPDVAYDARGSRKSKIYIPHTEYGDDRNWALVQVVKTRAGLAVLPQVRRELDALDPELVIYRARTMEQVLGRHMQSDRFALTLMGIFGAVAVLLAAIGVYGILSYSVSQRTREFGIRMALGATTGAVRRRVLTQGAVLAGIGLLAGLLAAFWLSQLLQGLMF